MRNFQDAFEIRKWSFISAFFNFFDCTFKKATLAALLFVEKQIALSFIVWREKTYIHTNKFAREIFFCLRVFYFETKNIYILIHIRLFHPTDFRNRDYFFWPYLF